MCNAVKSFGDLAPHLIFVLLEESLYQIFAIYDEDIKLQSFTKGKPWLLAHFDAVHGVIIYN